MPRWPHDSEPACERSPPSHCRCPGSPITKRSRGPSRSSGPTVGRRSTSTAVSRASATPGPRSTSAASGSNAATDTATTPSERHCSTVSTTGRLRSVPSTSSTCDPVLTTCPSAASTWPAASSRTAFSTWAASIPMAASCTCTSTGPTGGSTIAGSCSRSASSPTTWVDRATTTAQSWATTT